MTQAREGCNLCGWHSPWRPVQHTITLSVDVMDHMRDDHHAVYLRAWPNLETRRAHDNGLLRGMAERIEGQDANEPPP